MKVGDVVEGRYRVEELLGGGAMGEVYRAVDVDLERPCCLKVIKRHQEPGLDLRAEARALAGVRHENVVGVYGFGRHEGAPYIAMEYVKGRDLGWLIFEHYHVHHAPIPVARAVQLVRALCDGLSAVHGAGIVHRDIKPQNVILEQRTGRAVLVDFGAAVGASWMGGTLGTPQYMPPEAFRGSAPSAQTDLYSLGCVAFELLCGKTPFSGPIAMQFIGHLKKIPPPPSVQAPDAHVPRALDQIILQCLQKSPELRFQNGAALCAALQQVPGYRPLRQRR